MLDDDTEPTLPHKPSIDYRLLLRGLFFGLAGFVIFVQIQRIGGTTLVWGIGGALAGIVAPILWDAFKKVKEEEKAFQSEVDARFDKLEQVARTFMTHTELDTLRADIGIARADCERALEISKFSSDTARANQERINDIISSGVIFQLTQKVTVMSLQYSIIKKLIQNKKVTLNDIDVEIDYEKE